MWNKRNKPPSSESQKNLITKTNELRDQLLASIAKLEQYAVALQVEVDRGGFTHGLEQLIHRLECVGVLG